MSEVEVAFRPRGWEYRWIIIANWFYDLWIIPRFEVIINTARISIQVNVILDVAVVNSTE